jgi:WD40 repeat protein
MSPKQRVPKTAILVVFLMVLLVGCAVPRTPAVETQTHVAATKLNGPLPPGEQVTYFKVSPNGGYVVYPIGGFPIYDPGLVPWGSSSGSPMPNSGTPAPNSTTLKVFSVPSEGGTFLELTSVISTPVRSTAQFEFSPNGQHVAFSLDSYARLLVVASLDGQIQEVINPDHYTGISTFTWSQDGQSIVFNMEGALYRWARADGTITKLNDVVEYGQFTPDKRYYVYERRPYDVADTNAGLWSMPLDGGPAVQLTPRVRFPNTVIYIDAPGPLPWQLTPDGTTVVYAAPDPNTEHFALFRVLVTGGPPQQLTFPQTVADSVFSIDISPDSQHVVFRTGSEYPPQEQRDLTGGDTLGLRSVPLAGGSVTSLVAALAAGENLPRVQISADSRWVVYTIGDKERSWKGSFVVPIGDGSSMKLTDPQAPTQEGLVVVSPYGWVGDTSTFLMRNADASNAPLGVCRTRIPVAGQPSSQLDPVVSALLSADQTFVVCDSDHQAPQGYTLFQVPLNGGPPVKLNGTLGPDQVVNHPFSITSDNKRVIYSAAPNKGGIAELYSVPAADQKP